MMLSPKAAALSDRGFCPTTIALPVPYVALISSEGRSVPSPNAALRSASSRDSEQRHHEIRKRHSLLGEFEVTRDGNVASHRGVLKMAQRRVAVSIARRESHE